MAKLTSWLYSPVKFLTPQDQSLTKNHSRPLSSFPDHENNTISVSSSRSLGYATYGPENGQPVYFFHGTPGSRLDGRYFAKAAEKLKARIISLERPGLGISQPDPKRTLLSWPEDVLAVADELGHKTFRVLGMSGGGPYSLACALAIPKDRLLATGILAGMGPVRETGFFGQGFPFMRVFNLLIWTFLPWLGKWYAKNVVFKPLLTGHAAKFGAKIRKAFSMISDENEVKMYNESGFLDTLLESMEESFRQGEQGYCCDADLICGRWPFKVAEVGAKDTGAIVLWQGEVDAQTPLPLAKYMCSKLGGMVRGPKGGAGTEETVESGRVLRVYKGEDHVSMIARNPEMILAELLDQA